MLNTHCNSYLGFNHITILYIISAFATFIYIIL
nr:MAG TPA: hypothetical protein [Caudoviricetes sp.]